MVNQRSHDHGSVKDGEATLPAVSKTAVSLCPEVSEHTETERPLRICPHRPPSPPAQCDWGAGYKAVAVKEKLLVMTPAYNLVRSVQQFWRGGGLKPQGTAVCLCCH